MTFDPTKVEWHKLMERKNLFFVGLAFTETESENFEKLLGFKLKHFLFKFTNGNWSTYKSDEEFKHLYAHISKVLQEKSIDIMSLAKKGREMNEIARQYIDTHARSPVEISVSNFDKEYQLYKDILLYGVTIPWDIIGAIETMPKEQQNDCKEISAAFESLRAVSLYPEYEREVLQKYRVYLAKNHSVDLQYLAMLTPQEIKEGIASNTIPDLETLKKRYEYCVFWHNPESKEIEFTFDASIENSIPQLKDIEITTTNEFRGNIAFKGKVTGKVRIVYEESECVSFQEGEILVSPSTNPSLMSAILKCAGIVTDEGGMTSHAAIIAREMKKPAVIGTKIATKVLKDGDIVEVDAEKGIVRIIK